MRHNERWVVSALMAAASGALLLSGGCEVDSASNRVRISPESSTIRKGEVGMFTAEGGYVYTWSLENEQWGRLSARHGNPVFYTSAYTPSNEPHSIQTIYVVSTYRDTTDYDDSTTNTTSTNEPANYHDSAEAYVVHKPDKDETTSDTGTGTTALVYRDMAGANAAGKP